MLKKVKYFEDKNLTDDEFVQISNNLRFLHAIAGQILFDYSIYIYIYIRKPWGWIFSNFVRESFSSSTITREHVKRE